MPLCVCEGVEWHKKAVSVSRWDGESQHYADVKSIKNKGPHAEHPDFMELKLWLIFLSHWEHCGQNRAGAEDQTV